VTASLSERPRHARPSRRWVRRAARRWRPAAGVLTALAMAGTLTVVLRNHSSTCSTTPVEERSLSDLGAFTRWLDDNQALGYVGEVGWPSGRDAAAWNRVADAWFDRADAAHLWVTAWGASRWWPASYRMALYRLSGRPGVPPVAGPQAAVVTAHFTAGGALRGVALPSGSFAAGRDGPTWYSNARPGRFEHDYYYENAADYESLARRGVQLVRLSFTWERVQPTPGGPLDATEVRRIKASVVDAHDAGLAVVLDLHNYGDYYVSDGPGQHRRLVLGSPELPTSALADLWAKLADTFRRTPGVLGYGLMNEPTDLAPSAAKGVRVWERASQQAVDAIRRQHDQRTVLVSGYGGSSPGTWPQLQPRAWIADPARAVRYETHQYFDAADSGGYALDYGAETVAAQQAGYRQACTSSVSSGSAPPSSGTDNGPVPNPRKL
jgi:hypothetical protein